MTNENKQKLFFGTVFVVLLVGAMLVAGSPWFTGMVGLRANFTSDTQGTDGTTPGSDPKPPESVPGGLVPTEPVPGEPGAGGGGGESYCGDYYCNGNEDAAICPTDCYATCGDQACTHNENQTTCPTDCVLGCGNNICENNLNENQLNCPVDCGSAEEKVTSQTSLLTIDYSKTENQPTPSQILEQLKQAGYESSIETITASLQNFCATRTVVIEQYYPGQSFATKTRTAIYLHIQNCDPASENAWKNLTLIEQINKQIAGSANELSTLTPVNIINPDPIIEFRIPFLEKQGTTIIYYLPKQLTTEQAGLFSYPIINQFTQTTANEIETLGCKSNSECTDNTCIIGRCISKNCYQIPALNGTACGFGKECINKTCTPKQLQTINQPANLIDTPAAILTIITLLLGAWIIREYIKP